MQQLVYPSDVSDQEWEVLASLLPPGKPGGRPRSVNLRQILNGIFYLVRSGCAWRMLPREYPPNKTVYHYFRQWRNDGTWERIHARLREQERQRKGREPTPSAAIVDSQSIKIAEQRGWRGYDGGKKIHGRKRHLLVDTEGLVLKAIVSPAHITDRTGAEVLLERVAPAVPRLAKIWADYSYRGKFVEWVRERFGWDLDIVTHRWTGIKGVWAKEGTVIDWEAIRPSGFHVLPRRWVVERTFGWICHSRRLRTDYESLLPSSEAMIYLVMIRLLIRRLARSPS